MDILPVHIGHDQVAARWDPPSQPAGTAFDAGVGQYSYEVKQAWPAAANHSTYDF
jgi:hypothetical protein